MPVFVKGSLESAAEQAGIVVDELVQTVKNVKAMFKMVTTRFRS